MKVSAAFSSEGAGKCRRGWRELLQAARESVFLRTDSFFATSWLVHSPTPELSEKPASIEEKLRHDDANTVISNTKVIQIFFRGRCYMTPLLPSLCIFFPQ
jgi:hypothetical protein